ncbi:MAG: bifunctional aspartate kinase/homoserine dehydrogenase I [Ignavibacteriales bacterium]|nr:bifunctional aspartate kinase/homoserine dehydrogenase I [Ignavibacteriales bacterium]
MRVLKFGGSSVGDAKRIRAVINIITQTPSAHGQVIVVASAMQDVTNQLIETSQRAFRGDRSYEQLLAELEARHLSVANELLGSEPAQQAHVFIVQAFQELREFIHGIWILGEITQRTLDFVMSYGEQLSGTLIAEALKHSGVPAEYVDSRTLIQTDLTYGSAQVNFDLTNWNILNHFRNRTGIQVITGFIARGPANETTTLGRGGSDYTASILGAALGAEEIEIWTDVDGVMTADPRRVSEAFSLETLSFEEAMELSHFGAKVIHPPTMLPALQKRIPIRIRNTFNPDFPGTLICESPSAAGESPVKGIACIDRISMLKVTGEGILQTVGIASRIFAALAKKDIEVNLITQSSSEHSICLAIATEHSRTAREVIELEFRVELHHGQISAITVENDCSIVAVVGERVQDIPGVTGKVFQALGRNGITPRAIAHGSSERNLTLVLRRSDLQKAMNALHDHLFLSRQKTINLFLLGPGLVGGTLLELLKDQEEFATSTLRTRFKVVGMANRRTMLFDERGIDLSTWKTQLAAAGQPTDLSEFSKQVRQYNAPNSIVVDCTGAESAVQVYLDFLRSSVSVVTSSKIANTLTQDFYHQLRLTASEHGAQFRYSTNVGAALPIIDSIKNIIQNGDAVETIEAVLSGTMSFIFNSVNSGKQFSEAVREAMNRGFTEPDPRVDLSGIDVARKLLILVREAGFEMELQDIEIEPYLPQSILGEGDFDASLADADAALEERRFAAQQHGRSLFFIARFDHGRARIGLEEVCPQHPFYHLSGNDNIVSLTTRSLYRQPFVVRGGGAGAKLTASGLFNDIVYISHSTN